MTARKQFADALPEYKIAGRILIQVERGRLEYTIAGDKTYILTPGNPGVVEPAVTHFVRPVGETAFFVEFYSAD